MSSATPAIPVTVLTGFLGSGKTTLLSAWLRRPELARTAVIVNEFGEIGLDHELLEASDEDLVALTTGCLCCAARGDLIRAVEDLLARQAAGSIDFERIVIETTGLADPVAVAQALAVDPALAGRAALRRILTTVDAVNGLDTLDRHEEARRQASIADRLIVTKPDLSNPTEIATLTTRLTAMNGAATIASVSFGDADPAEWLPAADDEWQQVALIDAAHAHAHDHHVEYDHHHHDGEGGVPSLAIRLETPVPAVALTLFLEALAEACGPELLRLKGIVHVAEAPERPVVVHGVQHVLHPPVWLEGWPSTDRSSRLVLLGAAFRPGWVEALLDTLGMEVAMAREVARS